MRISLFRIIVFLFLGTFFSGFSQEKLQKKYSLDWVSNAQITISNGEQITLPLVKYNFIDSDGVPSFTDNWQIAPGFTKVDYNVSNVVYTTVASDLLTTIDIAKIPTSVELELALTEGSASKGLALQMTPLIREGTVVKKVVSFELNYSLSTVAKKLSKQPFVNSVLQTGSWHKFATTNTGVYRLDYNFLKNMGIPVDNIDPRKIQIYGNGGAMLPNLNSAFRHNDLQENAIVVSGENDGTFNAEDYILFFAQGPHEWDLSNENNIHHNYNVFSEQAYYFITYEQQNGKRISNASTVTNPTTDIVTTYTDFSFIEDDVTNIIGAGREWYGDSYLINNVHTYDFNFTNIDTSQDLKINIRGASTSAINTQFNVFYNATSLGNVRFSGVSGLDKARAGQNSFSVTPTSNAVNLELRYQNNGDPSANAYLDYIEVIGEKTLRASGNQFLFRNFVSKQAGKILEYQIQNKNNISDVWDVSDPLNPKRILDEGSSNNFIFKASSGSLKNYAVLNGANYFSPINLQNSVVTNQNLHGLQDIQYLIITRENLIPQAQRLASYHEKSSNLTTKVVALHQIYNEFGSGSPDITAIRDFVKYLYDNATTAENKPKFLCSFGDGSYDYKDRISGNNNIVPVYLSEKSFNLATSYVTDDYYGMMGENEGNMSFSDKQDIAVGRILVSNEIEASVVMDKILAYYNPTYFKGWRNSVTLVSDDLDNENEYVFQEDLDIISDSIKKYRPNFNIKKIYADAFVKQETAGGARYPDVNTAISNAMEKGSLFLNYFGHGGESGFASERIVTLGDIKSWVNFEKSPLFTTITCDFTRFDNPARFTAGEEMVVSTKGGSCSLISTTREVYISFGRLFNKALIPNVLSFGNNNENSIAQNLMHTKNSTASASGQHFFIYYFGDPAMKLGMGVPEVKITHINGKDVTVARDTLKSLSKITISGQVQTSAGVVLTDYNGDIATVIYDKPVWKQTLNNDNYVVNGVPLIMDFETQEDAVFKGKNEVNEGKFSFEFIVPKDIKLAYGKSKVSFYTSDNITPKTGADFQTVIGGISDNIIEDSKGPEVALFMEGETFVDGGNTSATPTLIAKFIDESGINTSSGSIGHAITAVIDGDEGNPIELNDFYEAEKGDFTKGTVNYTFRDLEPGVHTLELKVWDTHNNVSQKSLTFNVTKSSEFVLENVLNYPNPFINFTEFWFTHNQPNELLEVKIYIFTVSGKLVKSIYETVQTSGNLSRTINWDGRDDFGDKIGKGVYVYKLEVKNINSGVKAEKFEKLVILQ